MKTNELYYLILVLGAFGSFAVAVAVATLQYKTWLRRQAPAVAAQPVPHTPAKPVLARAA